METEMIVVLEYPCPRCAAALEARAGRADGWLRCPHCGRASLPPQPARSPRPRSRARERPIEGVSITGPGPLDAANGVDRFRPGVSRRIACASAMFVSLLITLVCILEQDRIVALLFAIIGLACLALGMYPDRPGR